MLPDRSYSEGQAILRSRPIPVEMSDYIRQDSEGIKISHKVKLTPDSWQSEQAVFTFVSNLWSAVTPFYDRANQVLESEIPGMNDHSLRHVQGVMRLAQNLISASEQAGKKPQNPRELLILYASVALHDVAQGVWGRKDHALLGSMIAQAIINNSTNHQSVADVILKIAASVRSHVTRDYDYDRAKMNDPIYAMLVLADECHIDKDRTTNEGRRNFVEQGNADEWNILNRMVKSSSWVWDSVEKLPKWVLQMDDLGKIKTDLAAHHRAGGRIGIDADRRAIDPELLCYTLLVELVLGQTKKNNLFRSACSAIFGTPNFIVTIEGEKTVQEYRSLSVKNARPIRN